MEGLDRSTVRWPVTAVWLLTRFMIEQLFSGRAGKVEPTALATGLDGLLPKKAVDRQALARIKCFWKNCAEKSDFKPESTVLMVVYCTVFVRGLLRRSLSEPVVIEWGY